MFNPLLSTLPSRESFMLTADLTRLASVAASIYELHPIQKWLKYCTPRAITSLPIKTDSSSLCRRKTVVPLEAVTDWGTADRTSVNNVQLPLLDQTGHWYRLSIPSLDLTSCGELVYRPCDPHRILLDFDENRNINFRSSSGGEPP